MSLDGRIDDDQDRAIRLDDRTIPAGKRDPPTPVEPSSPISPGGATASLKSSVLHRPHGDTIRRELTRLKYARFQEGRCEEEDEGKREDKQQDGGETGPSSRAKHSRGGSLGPRLTIESNRPSFLPARPKPAARPTKKHKKPSEREYVVDILYENQRGWFFCGIPLYSSKSLLNFDPAPWQTEDFKDSPVNITNAQVPDPTWIWAWPSWYVDMSHDVDEEGWEYSFSFRQGFAWHGSSPWWTSYVRRRRWLRKRVRSHTVHGIHDAWHKGHQMNPDYFTIHGAAGATESSRDSSVERSTRPTSTLFSTTLTAAEAEGGSDSDEGPDASIPNVVALLKRLKRTTVDRKKLAALRRFLDQGGAELHYLPDAMPDIMSLFMYQHSRREALAELERALEAVKPSSAAPPRPETDPPSQHISTPVPDPPKGSNASRAADLQHALDTVAAHVHAHDLAPDGTIRSPTSAHYQYHYNSYHSHHTHRSHSSHHHTRSESSAKHTDTPQDTNLAPSTPFQPQWRETNDPRHDSISLHTMTTTASHDDVINSYASPLASVAGSTVELGSSPTREVDEGGIRIKGIPEAAHVGEDVGIAARMEAELTSMREQEEAQSREKGKGKEKEKGKEAERKERMEWEDDGVD